MRTISNKKKTKIGSVIFVLGTTVSLHSTLVEISRTLLFVSLGERVIDVFFIELKERIESI